MATSLRNTDAINVVLLVDFFTFRQHTCHLANVEVSSIDITRGGSSQHGLMCGCNFVSNGVLIDPYRPK